MGNTQHLWGGTFEDSWSLQRDQFAALNEDGSLIINREYTQMMPDFMKWKQDPVYPGYSYPGGIKWRNAGRYQAWSREYQYTPTRESVGPMWWWYNQIYVDSGIYNNGYNPNDWSYPGFDYDQDLKNQALAECAIRLNEREVDLGVALAESSESINMLREAAKGFLRDLINAKRGQFAGRRGSLYRDYRSIGNIVLQWKYGWQPLAKDLFDLYKAATHTPQPKPIIFSASRRLSKQHSGQWNPCNKPGGTYTVDNGIYAKIYAMVSASHIASLQRIGVANPIEIGWELVPYSFVLDWFMPIGTYLQALSATAGLDFIGGFVTWRGKGEFVSPLQACGKVKVNVTSMDRTPLSGFPSVSNGFRPYAKPNPLSKKHAADIAQLIAQARL